MLFDHITAENLTLKIAETPAEIAAAQHLRYAVFYEEMGAQPLGDMATVRRDYDHYDAFCDHLIVVDDHLPSDQQVIGTYRMLTPESVTRNNSAYYTETEFDLSRLKAKNGRIMEISRSCIRADYRSKLAINLLWKGIAACVFKNNIDYLIGMSSFSGIDPLEHQQAISYLNHFHKADDSLMPIGLPAYHKPLARLPVDNLNAKRIFADLPPLFKGYLRIGVTVSEDFSVDEQFNMIDMCVILDIANVADRYFSHYKRYDTE